MEKVIEHESYAQSIYDNQKMYDNYEESYKIAQDNMISVKFTDWKERENNKMKFVEDEIQLIEAEFAQRYEEYTNTKSKVKRKDDFSHKEEGYWDFIKLALFLLWDGISFFGFAYYKI